MSSPEELCGICKASEWKYTCPKCNVRYCSVDCYKAQSHLVCSEEFYKDSVYEELDSRGGQFQGDIQKMLDILTRMREFDAGVASEDHFNDGLDNEEVDSDDDAAPNLDDDEAGDDGGEDLCDRLENVDLDDTNEVLARMTESQRADFEKQVSSGEIYKLLPKYTPWWVVPTNVMKKKIVELDEEPEKSRSKIVYSGDAVHEQMPEAHTSIPKFISIFKKEPSPCLHYNLWNIIASYGCMKRYFEDSHLRFADEAASVIVNLSATIKYCTNFEDVSDALLAVEAEAIAMESGIKPIGRSGSITVMQQIFISRDQLQYDAQKLMSTPRNKVAALSDILLTLRMAKVRMTTNKEAADMQKLYALASGNMPLTLEKLNPIIKKIQFMLSYVTRDTK